MSQRLATAEWADPEIYAKEHAYEEGKFWLGRSPLNGQPLGYVDDRHICLVSGTRAGKGTTCIINNLCLWPGSVVVVDPKGENATVTAARRGKGSEHCEGMGQAVHVLDPFNAAQVDDSLRSRFNPLDTLDPNDPITIDEAGRVADAIVVMNPESKEPFWDQSARTLVKGLILHVLTAPQYEGRRNLVTIRRLIARGDYEGVATLKEMGEPELPPAQGLLWEDVAQNNAFNGVIAGIGEDLASKFKDSPKHFHSVLSIANRNTEFLDSPGMQACLETSDFKLSDLKTDPNGVSVYLSLPQRYMGEHFRWLRMMITLAMTEMEATKGQPATGHRVLMCLDEFAGLKRMEVIENAVAQIAGYGVKLFFVLQSLEQLKATYKDNWETFLSNAGLKIFFGINDHFTREYVSKFIGETELLRELGTSTNTVNRQTTQSAGSSSSSSWNQQESTGVSFSDNWKAMPFFLRNTAGLLAAVTGKRQAARSSNTNTAQSGGGSDGTQSTKALATGSATASGRNESLYKRPLITPDEIGQHFGRIDDKSNPTYPGLGLVLVTGERPSIVQRGNYFEEKLLQRCFQPHPDHSFVAFDDLRIPEKIEAPQVNRCVDWIDPASYRTTFTHRTLIDAKGYNYFSSDELTRFKCEVSPSPHGETLWLQALFFPLTVPLFLFRKIGDRNASFFLQSNRHRNRLYLTDCRLVLVRYILQGDYSIDSVPYHEITNLELIDGGDDQFDFYKLDIMSQDGRDQHLRFHCDKENGSKAEIRALRNLGLIPE